MQVQSWWNTTPCLSSKHAEAGKGIVAGHTILLWTGSPGTCSLLKKEYVGQYLRRKRRTDHVKSGNVRVGDLQNLIRIWFLLIYLLYFSYLGTEATVQFMVDMVVFHPP